MKASCFLFVLFCMAAANAPAAYADKPVRFTIPFAPRGTNDILARLVAKKLSTRLGQPFVVDDRAGANGLVGCEIVARATPDGLPDLMAGRVSTFFGSIATLRPVQGGARWYRTRMTRVERV